MSPTTPGNASGAPRALGLLVIVGVLAVVGVLAAVGLFGVGGAFWERQAGGGAVAQDPTPTPTAVAAAAEEPTAASAPPAAAEFDAVGVVEQVAPAVVTVNNLQQTGGGLLGGTDPQQAGVGTGFILDDDGYVVTNEHVVRGGDEFAVVFADGEQRPAELIGSDPLADLAVVRIEGALPGTLALGDSDGLRVGEPVLAVGSPLGAFTNTVTQGIVSALNRDFPRQSPCEGIYTNLIQHDAAINPGNSGGPLFNAAGEVVGVNTLGIPEAQGLFFAVPASTVERITTGLIEDGSVEYPFFGVTGQPVTGEIASSENLSVADGQFVIEVAPDDAAEAAGIEVGDVIVAIDGQAIDRSNSFTNVLFAHEPGETVDVAVRRGDEDVEVEVTLGERPPLPEECFVENIVP